jgi:hypothetical protein
MLYGVYILLNKSIMAGHLISDQILSIVDLELSKKIPTSRLWGTQCILLF